MRPMRLMRPMETYGDGGERNGYPFTTFTDFPDFLGIMPRVLSDDLVVGRFVAYVSVECFPLFP